MHIYIRRNDAGQFALDIEASADYGPADSVVSQWYPSSAEVIAVIARQMIDLFHGGDNSCETVFGCKE
jgi:hypothetical protein